jgi:hypothetical protein
MFYKTPSQNNLYGTIYTVESKRILSELFVVSGWSCRKSTWTDFEVKSDWAEIIIENEDKSPLVNGAIDPAMFDNFRFLLEFHKIKYSLELYDEQGDLIRKESNNE